MGTEFWTSEEYDLEAQELYESGDFEAALELLYEGMRLYPSSAELRVSAGYAELGREEYAWARSQFEEALVLDPDHEEALIGLGEVLLRFGERTRAFQHFEQVLDLGYADDAGLMLSIGRALYRHELHGQAERFFRLALAADDEAAPAAAELGYVLHARGQVQEARHWLRQALESDPEHHEARAFYANLLYEAGRHEQALREFQRVPVSELWDPLAVWRTIELLRGFEGLPPEAEKLTPYLKRMETLNPELTPEERLLAEVEATADAGDEPPAGLTDRNQLDLFGGPVPPDGSTGSGEGGAGRQDRGAGTAGAGRQGRGEPDPGPADDPAGRGRPGDRPGGGSGDGPAGWHTVRGLDGRVYTGNWPGIVRAMRDASSRPDLSLRAFMQEFARKVENVTGLRVPTGDPETFVRAAAEAGMLQIEE